MATMSLARAGGSRLGHYARRAGHRVVRTLERVAPFRWGFVDAERVLDVFRPRGIIHVGAHHGQEAPLYAAKGVPHVLWIEPIPHVFAELQRRVVPLGHECVSALVYREDDATRTFHLSSNHEGVSSSIYGWGEEMSRMFPEVGRSGTLELSTRRLDTILQERAAGGGGDPSDFDMVVLDVQGAELDVLHGMPDALARTRVVVTEVSRRPIYEGGARFADVDAFLRGRGFRTHLDFVRPAHGDKLYFRS